MITNYLPKFKVVEINDSVALRSGHMLSQVPVDAAITKKTIAIDDDKSVSFVENGLIVGLGANYTIENYDATKHSQAFLVYTEELNTFINELHYFANELIEDEDNFVRALALYVGDTFTTNNYSGTLEGAKFAKVVDGVLTLQTAADIDTMFIAKPTTMPNGTAGCEFTYYKA